jgi:hypothetical protein
VVDAMTRAQNYKIVLPTARGEGSNRGIAFNITTGDQYYKKSNYDQNNKKNKYQNNNKDKNTSKKDDTKNDAKDDAKEKDTSDNKNNNKKNSGYKKTRGCWNCGDPNHYMNECPKLAEASKECNVTFCCNTTNDFNLDEKRFKILADNQATVSIFKEKSLLKNIRKIKEKVTINGIGGEIIVDEIGEYDFFGDVYYSPKASANVLCFYDLQQKFDVIYDENIFIVTLPNGDEIKFEPEGKLYMYNPVKNEFCNVQTVQSNEMIYTKREVQAAKQAQELMRRLGYPSTGDLIKMISNGTILNCPVTITDVKRAIEIYGRDLASLKGKTTTTKSRIAQIDDLNGSKYQNGNVCLCVDIMFINGVSFLISVSEDIGYGK